MFKDGSMSNCTALSTCGFVPLTRGFTAMVDANDLQIVSALKWSVAIGKLGRTRKVYAAAWVGARFSPSIRRGIVRMHRLILNNVGGSALDHIDGNGLNNRRNNLRVATNQENLRNASKFVHGRNRVATSVFKGVNYCRGWRARITVDGKHRGLGYHATEEAAARAYDRAARQLFGEFARLNFPDEVLA
jgi:hypothetical protein